MHLTWITAGLELANHVLPVPADRLADQDPVENWMFIFHIGSVFIGVSPSSTGGSHISLLCTWHSVLLLRISFTVTFMGSVGLSGKRNVGETRNF